MTRVISYLRQDLWSPYVAGILLGVVAVASVWFADHTLGSSGAFSNVSSYVGQELTTDSLEIDGQSYTVAREDYEDQYQYFSFTMPAGITWQVWLLGGVLLGGMTSAMLSRGFKFTRMPHSPQWRSVFGNKWPVRWGLVFISGVLIMVAARIAGGCTSGLAISGGVQLSPAAFLFIPAIFASGSLTAMLVYRRKY